MSTLHLPGRENLTHLQRAFRVFERMRGHLLSGRGLAALMQCEVPAAYHYIKRLKAAKIIERQGGSGKVPLYGLRDGATMPPGDARGGRRPRGKPAEAAMHEDLQLDLCSTGGE
jgi:hypothetical protein